jgi:hypothetical protein
MREQCFNKKGSDPPICGVHNVRLVRGVISSMDSPLGGGNIPYLKCPVIGAVVNDSDQTPKPRQ